MDSERQSHSREPSAQTRPEVACCVPTGRTGLALVLSGPSGSGKTTLARRLVDENEDAIFSISATTRSQREGERDGVDYAFLTRQQFEQDLAAGQFLEHATVFGRDYYGTPRKPVEQALARGLTIVLDIDVQGAMQVQRALPAAVLVFVLPPSPKELERRLRVRAREDGKEIAHRMEEVQRELTYIRHYDYLVINDDLDRAYLEVEAIRRAEQCRLSRRSTSVAWKI